MLHNDALDCGFCNHGDKGAMPFRERIKMGCRDNCVAMEGEINFTFVHAGGLQVYVHVFVSVEI